MSVYQNRLIIKQGATFDTQIQFKLPPDNGVAYPSYEDFKNAPNYPLPGVSVEGKLADRAGNPLVDLQPTVVDASEGIINVRLDDTTTGSLPAVEAVCDFHDIQADGDRLPLGSILFRIERQTTP